MNNNKNNYMQKPLYLQTWVISIMFALWFLLVPLVIGVVLLILQIDFDKKQKQNYIAIDDAVAYSKRIKNEANSVLQQKRIESEKLLEDAKIQCEIINNQAKRLTDEIIVKKNELEKINNDIFIEMTMISIDDSITSEEYKSKYNLLLLKEKELSKSGASAIIMSTDISKKLIDNDIKQIIRCFNSETASVLSNVTIKNIDMVKNKIVKSFESLNKLFVSDHVEINKDLLEIKLQEADLLYAYQYQKEQEREQQKAIKEQMLEEEKVRREIEKEKIKIEKEEKQFKNEISKLMTYLQKSSEIEKQLYIDKIKELEEKLKQTEKAKENVFNREQNTRAGFVYVISNIGSFGDDVYKIGMTRRLEPMDRVNELGNASVPFEFDVHAMIFSDDAPALESILHKHFEKNKINKINPRKEFFKVSLSEIEDVVKANYNGTVTFTKIAEAYQYRESLRLSQAEINNK